MAELASTRVTARGADLLHGALATVPAKDGWVLPQRVSEAQMRALGSVRAWHPGVFKQMAACASGVRLEFETDSASVCVELRAGDVPRGSLSVLRDVAAHTGVEPPRADVVSVDVDDRHLGPFELGEKNMLELDLEEPGAQATLPLPGMGPRRRVRVWLPCLAPCSVRDVTGDGSFIEPVEPRKALLVLGDSIAQGFVATDPARTWPALVADHLGFDLVNQGIGAQVFQPGSLADAPSLVEPAAIVVEFADNYRFEPCSAGNVARDVHAYLDEVSAAWPEVPTWVLTTPPHTDLLYPTHPRSCVGEVDRMIEEEARRHAQMRLVRSEVLLDAHLLPQLLADGSDHPGDAGQRMIADRLSFAIDATFEDREARAAAAKELIGDVDSALPLSAALDAGGFEATLVDSDGIFVDGPFGIRLICSNDRKFVRRALACLGPARVTCVCGTRSVAREVARAARGTARPCHLAVWDEPGTPSPDPSRDIRPLTPAYADAVRQSYSHPEFLAPGELEVLLAAGRVLGGFERGRLVGFVGEHPQGAMGMLEVLEEARGRGWGRALALAKMRQIRCEAKVPWAEILPESEASLALVTSLGFEVRPAEEMWFVL